MENLTISIDKHADWDIEACAELMPVDGFFDDPDKESAIKDALDNGNQWAWCSVIVTCRFGALIAQSILPGVSCKDETDFKLSNPDLYLNMKNECLEGIAQDIIWIVDHIKEALHGYINKIHK